MKTNLMPSGISASVVAIWLAAAKVRAWLYQIGLLRSKSLRTPVISIGNLSFGGTGKTPFAVWLASRLQARGLRPSILTRGYKRTSTDRVKIHIPGSLVGSARDDGDEVQLFLRHLNVPVGISSSRYDAGRAVEDATTVDLHLLDDGFQHLRLERTINIVLIDAANPWGARPGWPYLLREGFSSLKRADAVILTRCELAESNVEKLKTGVRSYRNDIPIYLARTEVVEFVDERDLSATGIAELRDRKTFAFCGLGNPQNFFRTLEGAGIAPIRRFAFADHHMYDAKDVATLSRLAKEAQVECYLTTEKDVLNFHSTTPFPLPVYWARIEMKIDDDDKLIDWIVDKAALSSQSIEALASRKNLEGAAANL